MRRFLLLPHSSASLGFGGYLVLTAPFTWAALHPTRDVADAGSPNLVNGKLLFYAGSLRHLPYLPGPEGRLALVAAWR